MLFKTQTVDYNGKTIKLYTTAWEGKKVEFGSLREAILYAMGFGTDQAAELRYEMVKMKEGENK